ncbi:MULTISPECIES: GntR family transcriptional regulator [unclassified Streptomyces]|uniref:GntR family transcriptional regulator n=1 Tax=unclassified Streptomyces TaxID=2593676 RepID=UPI000A9C222A|nr:MULTISPECIES: GntR family transcriptional regulator [unclassified Streptomyces]
MAVECRRSWKRIVRSPARSADFEDAFEKVAGDLQQQIYTGTLAPGARLPAREVLAEHYAVPLNVVTSTIALLASNSLLRYPGELPGDEVYVRDWGDHGFATQLIHGSLVRKIRDGSLPRGATVTVDEVIAMIGGDAEAADQALTFLALEGRVKKIHQRSGARQQIAYIIVGGEFSTEVPVPVQPANESPDAPQREFPAEAGLADLRARTGRWPSTPLTGDVRSGRPPENARPDGDRDRRSPDRRTRLPRQRARRERVGVLVRPLPRRSS